jgi:N6-adenosine-specific RNA methylase IME4
MNNPFSEIPSNYFSAILADPPWHFENWGDNSETDVRRHYETMSITEIADLPVRSLATKDCVLFLWVCWPTMDQALKVIDAWGFKYKTCAFAWVKANGLQIDMFEEDVPVQIGTGYWTRSNSEVCLLATKGNPRRLNADVRQAIVSPRREHSRKPEGIHERIERLVAGPYLELFARQKRPNWSHWGNQTDKFPEQQERGIQCTA